MVLFKSSEDYASPLFSANDRLHTINNVLNTFKKKGEHNAE